MTSPLSEFQELRIHIERLRAMLETLVVRGLRACGPDELAELKSHTEHLERAGAGHVASILSKLHGEIEQDQRTSAATLLNAQTAVRLLERLLTLRVVGSQFASAIAAMEHPESAVDDESDGDDDDGEEEGA
jgi:hypothetical protein